MQPPSPGQLFLQLMNKYQFGNAWLARRLGIKSSGVIADWFKSGVPAEHADRVAYLMRCQPSMIVRQYKNAHQGINLQQKMVLLDMLPFSLALAAGVTEQQVAEWSTFGVPNIYVDAVAKILECDKESIVSKMSQAGLTFRSLAQKKGINIKSISARYCVTETTVNSWFCTGVPRRHCQDMSKLLHCDPIEIMKTK